MQKYPNNLISHRLYPKIQNKDIFEYCLIRKTEEDLYSIHDLDIDDYIKKIVAPQKSTEVFELSTYLYGYYNESHVGMKTDHNELWSYKEKSLLPSEVKCEKEIMYPLFLNAKFLNDKSIVFKENKYLLLGYDTKGTLLEIMYNIIEGENINVFHAMPCRKAFYNLVRGTYGDND